MAPCRLLVLQDIIVQSKRPVAWFPRPQNVVTCFRLRKHVQVVSSKNGLASLFFEAMKKVNPHFVQLTQDACLKSFWRRRTLCTFLRQHHIAEGMLASWAEHETKRDFLSRLFDKLASSGHARTQSLVLDIARSLAAQEHFPDLENWENSPLKLEDAREAVGRVKKEIAKLDASEHDQAEVQRRRTDSERRRQQTLAAVQTMERLKSRLDELGARLGSQEAGYEFQTWFYDLVDFFEVNSRRPYTVDGRQIDGALTLDGTTYLVELKFTRNGTDAPEVDVFRRKVTSKADNTMGLFISMSGFTSTAKDAASGERTPLLLLDYQHLYAVLMSVMTLPEIINRVKRHASQTAVAYLAVTDFSG